MCTTTRQAAGRPIDLSVFVASDSVRTTSSGPAHSHIWKLCAVYYSPGRASGGPFFQGSRIDHSCTSSPETFSSLLSSFLYHTITILYYSVPGETPRPDTTIYLYSRKTPLSMNPVDGAFVLPTQARLASSNGTPRNDGLTPGPAARTTTPQPDAQLSGSPQQASSSMPADAYKNNERLFPLLKNGLSDEKSYVGGLR